MYVCASPQSCIFSDLRERSNLATEIFLNSRIILWYCIEIPFCISNTGAKKTTTICTIVKYPVRPKRSHCWRIIEGNYLKTDCAPC